MGVFFPLKKVVEQDTSLVGEYAKRFAKLDGVLSVPFTLVISSKVFEQFIVYNNLQNLISEKPISNSDRVSFFTRVSVAFSNARFPQSIVSELKECFELVTLDTTDLTSLTDLAKKTSILSLRRSTDYVDGDTICSGLIHTKDDFIIFLELLKSSYVSLFSPSSVKFRQERGISSFTSAVLLSRLPPIQNCFHAKYSPKKIQVESYVGFLDYSNSVSKDVFDVSVDFLKIEASDIKRQEMVSVFNVETNTPQIKTYVSGSSASQSAPDTTILEIGRLAKRVASVIESDSFSLKATANKSSQPIVVEVNLSSSSFEVVTPEQSSNSLDGFDFEVKDTLESESTKVFIEHIKNFLRTHQQGKCSSSVEMSLRSLDNEVTKESILAALQTCEEIVKEL